MTKKEHSLTVVLVDPTGKSFRKRNKKVLTPFLKVAFGKCIIFFLENTSSFCSKKNKKKMKRHTEKSLTSGLVVCLGIINTLCALVAMCNCIKKKLYPVSLLILLSWVLSWAYGEAALVLISGTLIWHNWLVLRRSSLFESWLGSFGVLCWTLFVEGFIVAFLQRHLFAKEEAWRRMACIVQLVWILVNIHEVFILKSESHAYQVKKHGGWLWRFGFALAILGQLHLAWSDQTEMDTLWCISVSFTSILILSMVPRAQSLLEDVWCSSTFPIEQNSSIFDLRSSSFQQQQQQQEHEQEQRKKFAFQKRLVGLQMSFDDFSRVPKRSFFPWKNKKMFVPFHFLKEGGNWWCSPADIMFWIECGPGEPDTPELLSLHAWLLRFSSEEEEEEKMSWDEKKMFERVMTGAPMETAVLAFRRLVMNECMLTLPRSKKHIPAGDLLYMLQLFLNNLYLTSKEFQTNPVVKIYLDIFVSMTMFGPSSLNKHLEALLAQHEDWLQNVYKGLIERRIVPLGLEETKEEEEEQENMVDMIDWCTSLENSAQDEREKFFQIGHLIQQMEKTNIYPKMWINKSNVSKLNKQLYRYDILVNESDIIHALLQLNAYTFAAIQLGKGGGGTSREAWTQTILIAFSDEYRLDSIILLLNRFLMKFSLQKEEEKTGACGPSLILLIEEQLWVHPRCFNVFQNEVIRKEWDSLEDEKRLGHLKFLANALVEFPRFWKSDCWTKSHLAFLSQLALKRLENDRTFNAVSSQLYNAGDKKEVDEFAWITFATLASIVLSMANEVLLNVPFQFSLDTLFHNCPQEVEQVLLSSPMIIASQSSIAEDNPFFNQILYWLRMNL
jgi:hypothetical protein